MPHSPIAPRRSTGSRGAPLPAAALLAIIAASVLLGGASARAADEPKKPVHPRPPADSITQHTIEVDGKSIPYTATAGTIMLAREDGTERGHIFYVAYTHDAPAGAPPRPVTFTFNGGPGSSSVWLHLGMLGPMRVAADPEGFPLAPPGELVENEHSLLDITDLVFIDPVMTGYSRPAEGQGKEQFHGYEQDIEAVAEFIRLWTTRNGRWDSPKFLCGESYGTTRAAGLSGELQNRHGMYLNGIILVSSILQFQTARFDRGNDLPYLLFLPTYAAIAHHHGMLPEALAGDLPTTLGEVERFALGEYSVALLRGARLPEAERDAIAEKVARYSGLTKEYVLDSDLRVPIQRFTKELLRDRGLTVGRLDGRFTGKDRDDAGERPESDPSYAAIQGSYTAAANSYLRETLRFEFDLPYEILTGRVQPWSYDSVENQYLDASETLRRAMTQNPALRVYVASGLHDLATPYFATRYTFDHLSSDRALLDRVTYGQFPAGHMMYIQLASLAELRRQLLDWYAAALAK